MADARTEKQKVKEITDKLEEGLKELFNSEKYKSYLSTMSKFHNYSFNNTLLIALQRPDATLVAGYQAWQRNFNRHVNKGERGIRILAPAPYKIKEERDKLDPVTGEVMLDKDGTPQTEEVEVKIPAFRAVYVRGMDAAEVVEALSAMNDNDRLNIAAYLESRGAWTMEIANHTIWMSGITPIQTRLLT